MDGDEDRRECRRDERNHDDKEEVEDDEVKRRVWLRVMIKCLVITKVEVSKLRMMMIGHDIDEDDWCPWSNGA